MGGGISAKYLLTALTVLLHLPTFVFGENIEPNFMKVWFKRIEKGGGEVIVQGQYVGWALRCKP